MKNVIPLFGNSHRRFWLLLSSGSKFRRYDFISKFMNRTNQFFHSNILACTAEINRISEVLTSSQEVL